MDNKEDNVKETENKEIVKEAEKREESLNESEIIDINKSEEEVKETSDGRVKRGLGGKNPPKTREDFIVNQQKKKKRKRRITLIVVLAVIIAIIMLIVNFINKTKDAFGDLMAGNVQTAFVEQKTLYDSKNATGTLYALESRTISRSLQGSGQGGAQINAINVQVGDHVSIGDVLVEFSSDNIEESIARAKEDIGTKKQLQAINAEDVQRKYVTQYEDAATSMTSTAKNVERKLEALHEACDAYGDAKRERDEAKDKAERDGINWESIKASYDSRVDSAYQAQKAAQRDYDDAVAAQAEGGAGSMSSVANSLSQADSEYKRAQITAGDEVKELQRKLNDSIESLDDYVVYATIDGIITEINVSEGNTFVSGNVLTIQDDSGFKADVLVDEYDIPKVKKAYNEKKAQGKNLDVVVKTDATGDEEFKGHVTLISPTSTTTANNGTSSSGSNSSGGSSGSSSGTANYKVSIELDETDEALMIGMSAKVAIVCDQSPENSLCVPYNCVEEIEDGKFIVKVMDENGDKNTVDDLKKDIGSDASNGNSSDIVVENNAGGAARKPKKQNPISKAVSDVTKNNKNEVAAGRNYREVEIDKIFETDYYVAVKAKNPDSLKTGDEVMIVTDKANGNDIMAMFGGPGPVGVY
ncbi:MAG: HlyD family efflux transporter periplasmic adaptor subunit [Lachnospiraceae bacterium]|nr:HlyD family efflux transporter periplasmic adaptor subunit [Lachnospiraceae bacterium]